MGGGNKLLALVAIVMAVATMLDGTSAASYVVGDNMGWQVPTGGEEAYDNWADRHRFVVGDVLVFNFVGNFVVARVTEDDYERCNTANPISVQTTSPTTFTVNTTGDYYFICTIGDHCSRGQKLDIDVNPNTASPSPPRSNPPPTPALPPTTTPPTTTYVVGDNTGWQVPSTVDDDFYDNWADRHRFVVGDNLVFNFVGNYVVARVTEDDYERCNTANPISVQTTSPATFTLNTTGDHYFICTIGDHCSRGQKLDIDVNPNTASPSPPRGSPPSTPASPPTTTPPPITIPPTTTYIVGDNVGWQVPTTDDDFYDNWADRHRFIIGDNLVFNFVGNYVVARVTEDDYDRCNTANPISVQTTSPATFTLNTTGDHYFICTIGDHCSRGQKLDVDVNPDTASPSTPPRSSPPPTPALAPTSTPPPTATPPTTTYVVGDNIGWQVPTTDDDFYDNWADRHRFVVGDVLVFNFVGNYLVARVTEDDYDRCNTANPISVQTTSPATFTLNFTGDHHFICTIGDHCSRGQKLEVEVNPNTGSPSTTTPPTNSPPVGTRPSTVTPSAASPSSAPTTAIAAFSIFLISMATTFLS